jgi:hypothetical protein
MLPTVRGAPNGRRKAGTRFSRETPRKYGAAGPGGEKFSYFAEDEAGHSWAGEFFTQVPSNAFEWCWDTGSTTSRTLGLRKQVVVDAFPPSVQDHTINLVV